MVIACMCIALLLCLSDSLGPYFFKSFTPLLAAIREFYYVSTCQRSAVIHQRFFSVCTEEILLLEIDLIRCCHYLRSWALLCEMSELIVCTFNVTGREELGF
jgi:hypothetical protein